MRTLKFTIAYDGTRYAGWQRQTNQKQPTIQETLEKILSRLLQERVRVIGSGRTDSGVHAVGQVAHIRIAKRMPLATLQRAANQLLPRDIVITRLARVRAAFHARFSARRKRYRYRLAVTPHPSPFARHYVYHVRRPLRVAAMRRAAQALTGTHDFRPFQSAGGRADTVRCVTEARWLRRDGELWFDIEANGFLYKMVRRIVGTLLEVGRGAQPPTVIRDILRTGNDRLVGPTAPAHGLTLVSVTYILPPLHTARAGNR